MKSLSIVTIFCEPKTWACNLTNDLMLQLPGTEATRKMGWAPVAYAYNPSYSGSRDQEDSSSKPTQANSLQDPISKKTYHNKGLVEWFKVQALSSNPSITKKKIGKMGE
jgi:hypothetical protein